MKNREILKKIIGEKLYSYYKYAPLRDLLLKVPKEKILIEQQQNSDIKYALIIGQECICGKRTVEQYTADTLCIALTVVEDFCKEMEDLTTISDSDAEYIIALLNFAMTWDKNNE